MNTQINEPVEVVQTQSQPPYWSVKQFAKRSPVFSEASLRGLIFKAEPRKSTQGKIPGNGLLECGAIVRLGGKVLINEMKFFNWVESQQS